MKLAAHILAAILLLKSGVASGQGQPPPVPWKAGVAVVKITPGKNMWMAGYASRKTPSEGVEQDLFAKALALEDEGGKRVVFLTMDLIGIPADLRKAVEHEGASREFQLAPEKHPDERLAHPLRAGVPHRRLALPRRHGAQGRRGRRVWRQTA